MTAAVFKSGYMLESLADPTLPDIGDNAMGAGNQQGRPDEISGTLRDCTPDPHRGEVKIQSELLGDWERQAEMTCPSSRTCEGSNNTVGPYPLRAQEA